MESGVVYCIDDDEDILLLYKIILGQAGHKVTTIATGAQALQAIEHQTPDLIILDEIMRNGMSGREICTCIRTNKELPYIPIIMVTGTDSKEDKIRSLEQGIDDYILKPFDHEELLAKVMVMLRIKRLYMDLLKTRQDLFQAEKLAAVGQLAAAMAHEIRNPLSIISASVQYLKGKLAQDQEVAEIMETILRKITEIDGTIRELLAAARPVKLKQTPVDINRCVREVLGFIKEKCLVQKVVLETRWEEPEPEIIGDEEHLQRVFLNILINALNSMPQGGKLIVSTECAADERVDIKIQDTGKGICQEDLAHLFEPFFSKHAGGSGLGLYVVKMIMDELNGHIQVQSTVDCGTEFVISLPGMKNRKKN